MRIRPENVRIKTKVFSISLPKEAAAELEKRAEREGKAPSRMITEIVVEAVGANLADIRGPGNPKRKQPDYWDRIKARMLAESGLEMSIRDIKRMFPKPPEVPE